MQKTTWNIKGKAVEMASFEGKIWFVNKPEDLRETGLFAGMTDQAQAERLLARREGQ